MVSEVCNVDIHIIGCNWLKEDKRATDPADFQLLSIEIADIVPIVSSSEVM